ncbi:MAG: hypothetical protein K2P20_08350 [Oscillospiraceae bacterium]|nr:hypothetical protein [Oscillospiraceae bacterium]
MIRAFWQSRLTAGAIWALSAVLAAVIWVRDLEQGYPLYIPIVAAVLTLCLGAAVGRLAGNIVANTRNTKLLGLLHVELDPRAFLDAYTPVPERLKKGSWDYAVSRSYLAGGYAAAGEFDRAASLLCPDCGGKPQAALAVRGLYYSNLCACALAQGDCDKARQAAAGLEAVVADPAASPAFAQNMGLQLTFCRERLACLEGGQVDRQWLSGQLKSAPYALRRLEILEVLARDALRRGRGAEARSWLEQMSEAAGKTYWGDWARQKLAELAD